MCVCVWVKYGKMDPNFAYTCGAVADSKLGVCCNEGEYYEHHIYTVQHWKILLSFVYLIKS